MLFIYQSNQLETLGQVLAAHLRQRPDGQSVFAPETVIVQNPDMAQWLKIQLAGELGIAANLSFPLPASFLWTLFRLLVADKVAEASPFEKGHIRWVLMQLLPELLEQGEFAPLKNYLEHCPEGPDPEEARQLRLYQLCHQIADVFDQYLMYRPEWLSDWEAGETLPGSHDSPDAENRWQPLLWQRLCAFIRDNEQTPFHRSDLFRYAIEALQKTPREALPPRLFIFGLSTMPRPMLQLFNALSQRTEVHLLLLNPCREFWTDIVSDKERVKQEVNAGGQEQYLTVGNPLLASMGQLCRDFHDLVIEETSISAEHNWENYQAPLSDSMLSRLQQEVLTLRCRQQVQPLDAEQLQSNQGKFEVASNDNSIQLHSCYTPLREVEVLHDQLLRLLQDDPALEPKDILVMTPDIERYAPYIEAVFTGQPRPRRIPHCINDLGAAQESPVLRSLLDMLRLPDSRMGLSEVLGLLEVPATLNRFGLSADEFEALKSWLADAGIRWGRDTEHRIDFGLPAFEQNSWAFGLKRLLLGYAMPAAAGQFKGTLPFDGIEGKQAESLGKLLMFVDQLDGYRRLFGRAQSIDVWQQQLTELLERLYLPEQADTLALSQASSAIQTLKQRLQQIGWSQPLCRQVVLAHLTETLSSASGNSRFLAGTVNFCTLMPMRSIPFKVICLLGMNDGDFPRDSRPVGFDLMAQNYRKGDRSRRLDDRYLFLEALLSARQKIYLSYLGRNVRDDKELTPSVLVSELVDYLKLAFMPAGMGADELDKTEQQLEAQLLTRHKLQPYNRSYFDGSDARLFTYAATWAQVHATHPLTTSLGAGASPGTLPGTPTGILPDNSSDTLSNTYSDFISAPLADYFSGEQRPYSVNPGQLCAFLLNPCKQFMQRRLGVYFQDLAEVGEDCENFGLDSLSAWKLKDEYIGLQASNADLDEAEWERNIYASGQLPVSHHGKQVLAGLKQTCQPMLEKVGDWLTLAAEKRALEIDLEIDHKTWRISGEADGMIDRGRSSWVRRVVKAGETKPKDLLRAWVHHLALSAQALQVRTLIISEKEVHSFSPLPAEQATALLSGLLSVYCRGLKQPLPFFPATSYAFVKEWQQLPAADEDGDALQSAPNDAQSSEAGSATSAEAAAPEDAKDAESVSDADAEADAEIGLPYAQFLGQVLNVWDPGFQRGAPPESADPYHMRCFPDLEAVWVPFTDISIEILAPLLAQLSRQTLNQFQKAEGAA